MVEFLRLKKEKHKLLTAEFCSIQPLTPIYGTYISRNCLLLPMLNFLKIEKQYKASVILNIFCLLTIKLQQAKRLILLLLLFHVNKILNKLLRKRYDFSSKAKFSNEEIDDARTDTSDASRRERTNKRKYGSRVTLSQGLLVSFLSQIKKQVKGLYKDDTLFKILFRNIEGYCNKLFNLDRELIKFLMKILFIQLHQATVAF